MTRRDKQDGFIIVAVLWMVAALALLAAIYTRFALTTAVASGVHEDRLRANALVSAAIELTAYQLTAEQALRPAQRASTGFTINQPQGTEGRQAPPPVQAQTVPMPSRGAFSFRLGRSGVTVDYQSESSRIDLNAAQKDVLAGLFRTLGAGPEAADYYAERIIGWRKKPDNTAGENEEATAYRVAGIAYKPRQGPFQHVGELWLVLGLPPQLIERALPFVTVYSGASDIDADNAAPEVLASQPNMGPERLGNVLQRRAGPLPLGQSAFNQQAQQQKLAASSAAPSYRLNIRVALDNRRRIAAEAVILVLEDADEPYRVLSWRDDFDGTS